MPSTLQLGEKEFHRGLFGKSNNFPNITKFLETSTQGAFNRDKSLKLTEIYLLLTVEHLEGMITS